MLERAQEVSWRDKANYNITPLEVFKLRFAFRIQKDEWGKKTDSTGKAACTNSLRIPPQKKHVNPVMINAECLQNHIRLTLLLLW
jgi:hypothetical protein